MIKKKDLHICVDCYCDLERNEFSTINILETIFDNFESQKPVKIDQNVISESLLRILEDWGFLVSTEVKNQSDENDTILALPLGCLVVDENECFFCGDDEY